MRDWDLEHPDITSALRTGYPRSFYNEQHYCTRCGCPMPIGYEDEDVCVDCMINEMECDYDF